jgi:anti-sigma-K factor RskA
MADIQSNEDVALRYVLGELNATERREFESLMTMSTGLRALVDELETGMIAMASAAPRRRPPADVWRQIEKTVAKKYSLKLGLPIFRFSWPHNGWAVSVICLVGWLFYAFLAHQRYAAAMTKLKNQ